MLKRLTGRVVGINLEPCDLQAAKRATTGTLWKMSGWTLVPPSKMHCRAAEMGVDLHRSDRQPRQRRQQSELIVEALKAISRPPSVTACVLAAGKMHASGVAGRGRGENHDPRRHCRGLHA